MNSTRKDLVIILGIGRFFGAEHRIRNQIRALSPFYRIAGFGSGGIDHLIDFKKISLPPRLFYRFIKLLGALLPKVRLRYEQYYLNKICKELVAYSPKFLIAHNILDGFLAINSKIPFVFDSHEYLPLQFDGNWLWRFTEIRYRRIALNLIFKQASLITVEGKKVAKTYSNEFSISRDKIFVSANMPIYHKKLTSNPKTSTKIRLIHHGILAPERGLEFLIEIVTRLGSNYEMTLMGPGPTKYISKLRKIAARAGNIIILDPVHYEKIVETLHEYDLGLVIFGSIHYHHKFMTVPNKFWECLQARIPVVVSPDSAMAEYVRENFCGVVPSEHSVERYVDAIRTLNVQKISKIKSDLESLAYNHSVDSWVSQYAHIVSLHCQPYKLAN